MINAFGLKYAQAGFMFTSYFLAYTIFAPIVGVLSDLVGGRRVIASFSALLGIGAILMVLSSNLLTACFFSFIMGAGASASWTPIVGLLSKWFSPSKRGMAIGVALVGSGLSFGIMGLILPLMVPVYGWRFSWLLSGLTMAFLALVNWLWLRDTPSDMGLKERGPKPTYKKPLESLSFWLIAISYFFFAFALYVAMTYLPTYAIDELGFKEAIASALMTSLGFGTIPGSLLFPPLSDRLGRRNVLIACNLVFALIFLGFALVRNYVFLMLCSFILGMLSWGALGTYAASSAEYLPREWSGTVMGLWTISYGAGASISPPVAGYIADVSGSFFWAFILALISGLISTSLLAPLRKKKLGG